MNLLILRHNVFHPGGVSPYEALLGQAGILPETFRFTEAPQAANAQRPATIIELRQLFETLNGFRYSVPIIPPGLHTGPLSLRPPSQRPQVVRMTTYNLAPGKCSAGPKEPQFTAGVVPQPQVPPPPLLLPRGYHMMPPTVLPPPPAPPRSASGPFETPTPFQALVEVANRVLPPLTTTSATAPPPPEPILAPVVTATGASRGAWPGPPAPGTSTGGTTPLSLSPLKLKKTSVEDGGPLQWRVQPKDGHPPQRTPPAPFPISPAHAIAGSRPDTPGCSPAEFGPQRAESLEFPPPASAEKSGSQSLARQQLDNTFSTNSPGSQRTSPAQATYAAVCHEPRQ